MSVRKKVRHDDVRLGAVHLQHQRSAEPLVVLANVDKVDLVTTDDSILFPWQRSLPLDADCRGINQLKFHLTRLTRNWKKKKIEVNDIQFALFRDLTVCDCRVWCRNESMNQ